MEAIALSCTLDAGGPSSADVLLDEVAAELPKQDVALRRAHHVRADHPYPELP